MAMRRIPLVYESYQAASSPLSSKLLLNMMAEQQPADARVPAALVPTPGLTVANTFGSGPIQAINDDLLGRLYVASGGVFYRVRPPGDPVTGGAIETLGTIGYPSTSLPVANLQVTISVSDAYAVVVVPPNAYYCPHSGPLSQITDSNFQGAYSVAQLDGYFVFPMAGQAGQFFLSPLNSPAGPYDALYFATAETCVGGLYRCVNLDGELWFFSASGNEVWQDVGASDFPFRRVDGGIIEQGAASPRSIAKTANSLFWLGPDGIVYRSVGLRAQRISTHSVEQIVSALADAPTDSLTYTQNGHIFYALSFPTATLVYDVMTGLWHNRASPGLPRWRAAFPTLRSTQFLLGDYANGNVYTPDTTTGIDGGAQLTRQMVLPPIYAATNRASMHRLEVEMEVGVLSPPASVTLDWSDDGGETFTGGPRTLSSGPAGSYRYRVYATRLGSFRQRVLRLTTAAHVTIYAVDADIEENAA